MATFTTKYEYEKKMQIDQIKVLECKFAWLYYDCENNFGFFGNKIALFTDILGDLNLDRRNL